MCELFDVTEILCVVTFHLMNVLLHLISYMQKYDA